jgi:signal transduction histidine kinase
MRPVRRPHTLYGKVYLHGVVLLVLVALALGALGFFFGRGHGWRWHPPVLARHVGALLAPVPDAAVPGLIGRFAGDLGVDIAVYRDDGSLLAATGVRIPPPLALGPVRRLHQEGRALVQGHRLASAPAGPGRYAAVAMRLSAEDVAWRLAGAMALLVMVLAVGSAPLARAIARPIEHLSRVARRLGEGDLSARANLRRGDEIGELARTFDEMAERFAQLLEGQRELLANVSHELRTPLSRVRVALSLAAEADPAEAARHLREAERDVLELERLVADLLTATRLDGGGGLVLRREPLDLAGLVEEALARFRRHHPQRPLDARLPGALAMEGEPALLTRVLDNLLDNAAKYSEGPVTVTLVESERGATLTVQDLGIGIAPEDLPHVFERFWRADRSRSREHGGAGLGLAITRKLVEAQGGCIGVESQPGRGSRFWFTLPVAPEASSRSG